MGAGVGGLKTDQGLREGYFQGWISFIELLPKSGLLRQYGECDDDNGVIGQVPHLK